MPKKYGRSITLIRGSLCAGPHQVSCTTVQMEAQATYSSAHKMVRA
jgi:hypothetical protein